MTRKKPVSLAFVDKLNKDVEKVEKYYIDFEQGHYINYYPKFGEKRIEELLKDLILTMDEIKNKKMDFLGNDLEILKYTHFLIIKHFTSLKSELEDKSLEIHLATFEKLINTGLFELFIVDMFDELEIQKIIDKVNNIADVGQRVIKELELQKKVLNEKLNNKDLISGDFIN